MSEGVYRVCEYDTRVFYFQDWILEEMGEKWRSCKLISNTKQPGECIRENPNSMHLSYSMHKRMINHKQRVISDVLKKNNSPLLCQLTIEEKLRLEFLKKDLEVD